MKKELFIIIFEDSEQIKERAWSLEQARILAQAKRIKRGKSYETIVGWKIASGYTHYYDTCDGYCDTCSRQHVCLTEYKNKNLFGGKVK